MLLTHELVTNSVVHTHTDCVDVRATCNGETLRVAVADSAPALPDPLLVEAEPAAGAGRGLWLVEEMSSRWGWEKLPEGKRVWFEVPCHEPRC